MIGGATMRVTAGSRARGLFFVGVFLLFVAVTLADRHQQSDEGAYVHLAYVIAGRQPPHAGAPSLWFGPGLPLLLAPLVLLHLPLEALRMLGPLLLVLALVGFDRLLVLFVPRRIALGTTAALAAYLPIYVLLPSLHSEVPAILAIVLFMYGVALDMQRPRPLHLLLAAGALAFLAVTRVVFGWVVLALLVFWVVAAGVARTRRPSWRRVAAAHALALVLCIPWLAHTYAVSHHVFYWSSAGGLSLYWMASPYANQVGDWHARGEVFARRGLAPNRRDFRRLRGLGQVQRDDSLRHRAIQYIKAHPRTYAKNLLNNLSRMWFNIPYSFKTESASALFYIVPNAFLLTAVVLAGVTLFRSRRRVPAPVWVTAAFVVFGIVFQVPLAAFPRMLVPLVPAMLFLVSWATAAMSDRTDRAQS